MKTPLQITFRDIEHSDALEAHIREKAEKLETVFEPIMSCRVVVEMPHRTSTRVGSSTCASTSACRAAKSW
ncbi:MAG: HPF/RaiA family ribosome-associated protein [Pseudomonadota bacterium]